ncbi:MAG: CRISPR-associated protein Cas4 [Thermoproteus sp.]|nr:CRISPR-associated protein Cas4 [Thermoproteus sp.]
MTYKPTPKDVLELMWCPRYLWYMRHIPLPPTERMLAGKRAEAAAVRRLSAMLKAEPKLVYVDVGWARGVIDAVAKRRSPVEVKLGPRREIYRWQLYAEAYLLANALRMAVYEAYIYYIDRDQLDKYAIGPDELKTGEILLKKAKKVVEGPPPISSKTPKCGYCEYRNICEIAQA